MLFGTLSAKLSQIWCHRGSWERVILHGYNLIKISYTEWC
jgi:hypothetical protein